MLEGLVAELEERDAALFNGYNWREWQSLSYQDKVDGVAHSRLSLLIKLVQNEVENQTLERLSRAKEH